ncbi:hypothetical protein ANN_13828 [Periplaneta americana]|uniref:Uncharacterized protein n=1 Tax=Periplaneta americana TaxID=6978 RepID=A0ABQ8SUM5_PERAM|nr:hypothetical protein ANN_13828 [Periplaneta americana]
MAGLCEGDNEPSGSLKAICYGRQHSMKCAKRKRCRRMCTVVQQKEIESIPISSYECTMVHNAFRGSESCRLALSAALSVLMHKQPRPLKTNTAWRGRFLARCGGLRSPA